MVKVEIIGYKKIEKGDKTLYYLSCISSEILPKTEGRTSYNAFTSKSALDKYNINERDLLGLSVEFFNVKNGDRYNSGISFKNIERGSK